MNLAERHLTQAAQENQGVCCALIDLDGFKPINDQHGHAASDQILRGMAKLLRRVAPPQAVIGRLGGDEFAILLTGVTEEEASALAQQMKVRVIGITIKISPTLSLTLQASIGVHWTDQTNTETTIDDLLSQADKLMYFAKTHGKHQVSFHSSTHPLAGFDPNAPAPVAPARVARHIPRRVLPVPPPRKVL